MELVIILALAFGAMWLMSSRTRKQQKEAANFRANLEPGQEVMTGSGLFGTIVAVEDDIVTIEASPGVTTRWLRAAIAKKVEPPVLDEEDDDLEYEDDEVEYDEDVQDDDSRTDERTSSGATGLLEDNGPRFEVPDDPSGLTDRRRPTDPGDGGATPRA